MSSVPFVSSKDVETAKQRLIEVPISEMPAFIGYALKEAARTNFAVKTLGGIKQYLTAYLALKKRDVAETARALVRQAQEREDAERQAYDQYRRRVADSLFQSLPKAEQDLIEELADKRTSGFEGSLRTSMLKFSKIRLAIERHGEKLTSFEQWKSDRSAA